MRAPRFSVAASPGSASPPAVTAAGQVTAILLSILFLGERLEWIDATGMILFPAGLATIDGRFPAWLVRGRQLRCSAG